MANLLALVRRVDTLGARSSISCGSKLTFVRPPARPQIQRNLRLGTVTKATAEVAANGIPSRREVLLKELGHLPFDRCRHYIASKLPPSPRHDLLEVAGGAVIIFVYFMVLVFPWLVSFLPFVTWGYHQIQAIITVFWGAALVYQWRCESVRWNKLRRLRAIERNSIGST